MSNFLGKRIEEVMADLDAGNQLYTLVPYSSRFKEDVTPNSRRIIRQRILADGTLELVYSDFKTDAQG